MNKKAQTNKTIAGLIMLIIVIAFIFYVFKSNVKSYEDIQLSKLSPLLSVKDYDGDGFPDATDVCPCGSDNSKLDINGKSYCGAFSFSKESCTTPFEWVPYKNMAGGRCLYRKYDCLVYVSAVYENKQKDVLGNLGTKSTATTTAGS